MTLVLLDSFENITTATWGLKGWGGNHPWVVINSTKPRTGTYSLYVNQYTYLMNLNIPEIILGNAVYHDYGAYPTSFNFLSFYLGPVGNLGMFLKFSAGGKVGVYNSSSVLQGETTNALALSSWKFFEIRYKPHNTSGEVEIYFDEHQELSLSGLDLNPVSDPTYISKIEFRDSARYVDDLYIIDTSGSPNDTFLGDHRIYCLFPDANGNTSNFTPSSGSDNYAMVDESPGHDSDTTYNSSGSGGFPVKDTLSIEDITGIGADSLVAGAQVCVIARKDDAGVATINPVLRSGGSDYDGSSANIGTTYEMVREIWDYDPAGGLWQVSDINSSEIGYKRTA